MTHLRTPPTKAPAVCSLLSPGLRRTLSKSCRSPPASHSLPVSSAPGVPREGPWTCTVEGRLRVCSDRGTLDGGGSWQVDSASSQSSYWAETLGRHPGSPCGTARGSSGAQSPSCHRAAPGPQGAAVEPHSDTSGGAGRDCVQRRLALADSHEVGSTLLGRPGKRKPDTSPGPQQEPSSTRDRRVHPRGWADAVVQGPNPSHVGG